LNRLARVLAGVVGLTVVVGGAPAAHAGNGFFTSRDLTDAGAPGAFSIPVGWVTPWDNRRHLAYRDDTANVIAGSAADVSNWSWAHATSQAGLPSDPNVAEPWAPASALMAYAYDWDLSSHIDFTGYDGHIRELWSTQSSPAWSAADLTAATGGPSAPRWVDPTAYAAGGSQHVIYQSAVDKSVWEMLFTPGSGWSTHSLNAMTGTAPSVNGWAFLGSAVAGSEQVVAYLNHDNKIHLIVNAGAGWSDVNISAASGGGVVATNTVQTLDVLPTVRNGVLQRLAVEYIGADDHLHELAQNAGGGWTDSDVTALTGGNEIFELLPHAAVVQPADGSEHIFVEDAEGVGTLTEYVRTRTGTWFRWTDVPSGAVDAATFVAPDGATGWTEYVAYPGLFSGPLYKHLTLLDMTVPNQ
jgi:hypothetical protein